MYYFFCFSYFKSCFPLHNYLQLYYCQLAIKTRPDRLIILLNSACFMHYVHCRNMLHYTFNTIIAARILTLILSPNHSFLQDTCLFFRVILLSLVKIIQETRSFIFIPPFCPRNITSLKYIASSVLKPRSNSVLLVLNLHVTRFFCLSSTNCNPLWCQNYSIGFPASPK